MARNDLGERQVHFIDDEGKETSITLKFTTRAIMAMENEMEMEAGEIEQKFRQGSIRTLCAMLWAGSMKHDRKKCPSIDVAADRLDQVEDMEKFSTALFEAWIAGMPGANKPEVEEDSENGSPKEKKGKKLAAVGSGDDST